MLIDAKREFLEKSMLGRKSNFEDSEDIIRACVSKSCDDMLTGARFYFEEGDKERIVESTLKLLNENNYQFNRYLINKLAIEIFPKKKPSESIKYEQEVKKEGEKKGKKIVRYVTGYGLAQKVINMSFKHFYVFNDYLKNKNIDYSNCDCPLDSIVLNNNNESSDNNPLENPNNYKWTNITEEQYNEIQNAIKELIDKNVNIKKRLSKYENINDIGNMSYDFLIW